MIGYRYERLFTGNLGAVDPAADSHTLFQGQTLRFRIYRWSMHGFVQPAAATGYFPAISVVSGIGPTFAQAGSGIVDGQFQVAPAAAITALDIDVDYGPEGRLFNLIEPAGGAAGLGIVNANAVVIPANFVFQMDFGCDLTPQTVPQVQPGGL